MASRLAQLALAKTSAKEAVDHSKARHFYLEICRCLPFIHRLHKAHEVVTLRELRSIIKAKFLPYTDVKDERVVDLLIFKGREDLETYLMMHKQRHHLITEFVEPYQMKKNNVVKLTGNTSFLDGFFSTQYPQTPMK